MILSLPELLSLPESWPLRAVPRSHRGVFRNRVRCRELR